ncbi:unnamed protein product [Toxocara canis]|uniref:UBA_e1_thiolCys domain-containing protein n=1 Tax=Toxocara canis TaxID=6265 RepID=A0A183V6Y9_TOXCA|nr:unnamed protein product [Toxocara canis]
MGLGQSDQVAVVTSGTATTQTNPLSCGTRDGYVVRSTEWRVPHGLSLCYFLAQAASGFKVEWDRLNANHHSLCNVLTHVQASPSLTTTIDEDRKIIFTLISVMSVNEEFLSTVMCSMPEMSTLQANQMMANYFAQSGRL